MKKAIIIDIDGTISDSKERVNFLKKCLKNNDSDLCYEVFYQTAINDKPLVKNIVRIASYFVYHFNLDEIRREEFDVIFLTGRPERIREDTIKWVEEYFFREKPKEGSVKYIFRKDKDFSQDIFYKKRELDKLKKDYKIMAVFEDREHLVEMFKKELPKVDVIKM